MSGELSCFLVLFFSFLSFQKLTIAIGSAESWAQVGDITLGAAREVTLYAAHEELFSAALF